MIRKPDVRKAGLALRRSLDWKFLSGNDFPQRTTYFMISIHDVRQYIRVLYQGSNLL